VVLPLLLLSILKTGSVIQYLKRILRRIFVTGRFIQNGKLFCLIFQTLLYLMCLTLGVGKPSKCPSMFILEFYSNIHAIDNFVP